MQILLICDNSSSKKQSELIPLIVSRLSEKGHDVRLSLKENGKAVFEEMKGLKKVSLVAVAGNDETLNEAVNGLMMNKQKDKISVVFIPTGENNFLAPEFGINSLEDALFAIEKKQACLFSPTKLVSPFESHYFSDFLCVGLAGLIHYVSTKKLDKKGFFFYLLKRVFKNPPFFEISVDGISYNAEMVVIETGKKSILPQSLKPKAESERFTLPLEEQKQKPFSLFIYEKESWMQMYKNLFKICFKPDTPLENTVEIKGSVVEIKELVFKEDKKTFSIESDGKKIPTSSLKLMPTKESIKVLCCLRED